jgi:hypothetical protein
MILSPEQIRIQDKYVEEIIENLPPLALQELLSGCESDLDKLLSTIRGEVLRVTNLDKTLDVEKLEYLSNMERSMDLTLRKLSYNYFKTVCLPSFRQGWRNLEWGNLIQLYLRVALLASRSHGKSFEGSFAFILWRLYSYDPPSLFTKDTIDNANRKETALIVNSSSLGEVLVLKLAEEIRVNDILSEKLNPQGKAKLGSKGIITETGSMLHMRGSEGMIRGLHVGSCVCDDLPDESSLYSQEQRDKLKEIFYGSITPIVEPYGYLWVLGTPYSPSDLYSDLKNDKNFKVFEYPAIFPNGQLLAPDRFTFDKLTQERESLGTLVFSREYLVVPIADSSTIFPYEYLKRSLRGMEAYVFAENIETFPVKMQRVVIGCDFAISGNIGADYSVFTVWGIDSFENIYLIAMFRGKGISHDLQVNKIVEFNFKYKPHKIVCESNGFQKILAGLAKERGLVNIEEFTTTEGKKKDLHSGLPSLSALFESGRLRVPYGDEKTRLLVNEMFGEFNSIAFNSSRGTLEASVGHDDICMSSFMAIQDLREHKQYFSIDFI